MIGGKWFSSPDYLTNLLIEKTGICQIIFKNLQFYVIRKEILQIPKKVIIL